MSERWPSPTDPIAFESLCADLWGAIWGRAAHKNGRNGQPQAGVDIYGKHGDDWIGIQCKQKDQLLRSKLTVTELAQEAAAARHFVPPLRRFIIATTGPSEVAVQKAARNLTDEHSRQGLFEVEVWSWSDIWSELNRRPGLLQAVGPIYWPRLFSVATEQRNQEQTDQILRAIQSPLLPCGLFLTFRIEASDEDLRRVYSDQPGFHGLPLQSAPTDGRHFLRDRYVDVRNGTVEAAGLVRLERPGYNDFHRNVKHTISRFDPSRCEKPISENEPLFCQPQVTLDFYREGRPPSIDTQPTLVLKSDINSVRLVASYAFDNTVLVDHEFPQLSVSPPDATGFSITSLRGSFIRLRLEFFFIKAIAWLPEQSWPQLHNLHILLGSRRHALTFSLDDLVGQSTRLNPNPIAKGPDVVMPQVVFECEIDAERFEKQVVNIVENVG